MFAFCVYCLNIRLKSPEEIEIMREGGAILTDILQKTLQEAKPGVKTIELERFAANLIEKSGAKPSFKTVRNYQFATCMCVNDTVVHGLPSDYALKEGDILGIDMGVLWKGFHTDASWTIIVQNSKLETRNSKQISNNKIQKSRFLQVGIEALGAAISAAHVGNYIWDISKAIQDVVEKKGGYHSVRALTGHGVGKILHEDPFIPCFVEGEREKTAKIQDGMTLAIEVIYGETTGKVWYAGEDGWTIATRNGSLAGLFEETIAIIDGKPQILTPIAKS